MTRRDSMSVIGAGALGLSAPSVQADESKQPTSEDARFSQPYIDKDEWRDRPVGHRYVHGGFKGAEARFSFYFPPKEQYQGRFFQPISAVSGDENAAQQVRNTSNPAIQQETSTIGFAAASGAYLVESNLGRMSVFPGDDYALVGYKTSAAWRSIRARWPRRCTVLTGRTVTRMVEAADH